MTVQAGLSFPNYYLNWNEGRPADPGAATQATTLLDQLSWWADALRRARAGAPYPA